MLQCSLLCPLKLRLTYFSTEFRVGSAKSIADEFSRDDADEVNCRLLSILGGLGEMPHIEIFPARAFSFENTYDCSSSQSSHKKEDERIDS